MWNNLKKLIQDSSYKRLVLALCVSIILHSLLFGGFDLKLPTFKKEMHTIQARIQMPKMVQKPVELAKEEKPIAPSVKPKPAIKVANKPVAAPEINDNAALTEPNTQATDMPAETDPVVVEPQKSEPEPTHPEDKKPEDANKDPQPEDIGLVINENAYQYVETDFDVRTKIDGNAEGTAKITFNLIDGKQYQLKSLMEPRGLAALFIGNLLQTSEGTLTKTGLQPLNYLYQFGDKADKTYTAKFDWANKKVVMHSAKGDKIEDLPEDGQDLLSFMYQFMYVAPLQTMQINITNGKKMASYDYSFDGEENINIALGEIKTMHLSHSAVDTDEKVDIWLATDYQYIPVKIRKLDKNGRVYEMVATRINTNRPTINK